MRFSKTIIVRGGVEPVLALTLEEGVLTVELLNNASGRSTVVELQALKDVLAELEA